MRDITLLRSSIPKNLEEAWLYYIMLIRGVPIPFDLYYTHFEGVIPFRPKRSAAIGGQGAQEGFNDKRSQELSSDDNQGRKYRSAKTKFGRDYTKNIQDEFLPEETTSGRLQQTLGEIPTSPASLFVTKKSELGEKGIDTTGNAEKRTEEDVHFPLKAYTHKDLGKAAVTSKEEEEEEQEEEQETAENDSSSFSEGVVPSSPVSPESFEEEIPLVQAHRQQKKEEVKEEEGKEEGKEEEKEEEKEKFFNLVLTHEGYQEYSSEPEKQETKQLGMGGSRVGPGNALPGPGRVG
jgi:hypothetical protein